MTHAPGRDPLPFPRYQNDDNFFGKGESQKGAYCQPTHIAQSQDPWNRLNKTQTLSSMRHEVFSHNPKAPQCALDFELTAQYNQGGALFADKNQTLVQKETLGIPTGVLLKNRAEPVPPKVLELNHPLREVPVPECVHISSIKQSVEGPHSQGTNTGYSRKPDGTFYAS